MSRQKTYTIKDYRSWIRMAEAGFTVPEISRICSVPVGTLRSMFKREGIEVTPAKTFSRLTHKDYDVPVHMYTVLEMTPEEIGEAMHLHPSGIRKRLKVAGVLLSQSEAAKRAYRKGRKIPTGRASERELTAA